MRSKKNLQAFSPAAMVKIYILGGTAVVLLAVYILTFVFDPQRRNMRGAAHTWMSSKYISDVTNITVRGGGEPGVGVKLEKIEGSWFVNFEDKKYPAKEEKAVELLETLSQTGAYPVRSRTDSAHSKLGVEENTAKQIIVKGNSGVIYLDLLIGNTDTTGKRYLRKNGSSEVRSGDDNLAAWGTTVTGYYDLRLFPGHDKDSLSVADVQRIIINPLPPEPPADGQEGDAAKPIQPWTLVRNGAEWLVEGQTGVKLDTVQADNYVRSILDATGDDFIQVLSASDEAYAADANLPGRLTIQSGDGKERMIRIGGKVNEKRTAAVGDRSYVFSLSDWTLKQLFKDYDSMKAQ